MRVGVGLNQLEQLSWNPSSRTLLPLATATKAQINQVAILGLENHYMVLIYLNLCFILVVHDG